MKTNLLGFRLNKAMSFQFNKEKFFMISILLVAVFFFTMIMKIGFGGNLQSKNPMADAGINYKMVHAEDGYSGFSLGDREVDYQYEALKKKQAEQKNVIPGQIQVPTVTKKQEATKKTTPKTAAQKAEEAKIDQAKKEILQKVLAEHVKQEHAKQKAYDYAMAQAQYNSNNTVTDKGVDTASSDKDNKKNKKSFSEWRALIYANPNQETMMKFIEAYRKGEVSPEDYQSMAQDLLEQNSDNFKGLGLMALRANPSLNSLSMMVHEEDELPASLKNYVQQGYNSYLQGQNVNILGQALKTSDKILVKKSLTILTNGLSKINSGDVSIFVSGGRNRGGGDVQQPTISMNNFKGLLGILAQLSINSDAQIATLAQQASGQIRSGGNSSSHVAGL